MLQVFSMKILIVDDEPDMISILRQTLYKPDVVFADAFNGAEALKVFDEFKPDLVVTDYQMPKMNGLDLAVELQSINSKIPVILLTGIDVPSEYQGIFSQVFRKPLDSYNFKIYVHEELKKIMNL